MRPKKGVVKERKKEFLKLYNSGKHTQKQISELMRISEKTICNWVASIPEVRYMEQAKKLSQRLEKAIDDPGTPIDDIWKLTNAIKRLHELCKVQ